MMNFLFGNFMRGRGSVGFINCAARFRFGDGASWLSENRNTLHVDECVRWAGCAAGLSSGAGGRGGILRRAGADFWVLDAHRRSRHRVRDAGCNRDGAPARRSSVHQLPRPALLRVGSRIPRCRVVLDLHGPRCALARLATFRQMTRACRHRQHEPGPATGRLKIRFCIAYGGRSD